MMSSPHKSVLLDESIKALSIMPGGVYIDGTFGRGGHSREILAKLDLGGKLIGIDKDPEAIKAGRELTDNNNFEIIHDSFSNIYEIAEQRNLLGKVNGILLDLGVSSPQLDKAERGFSFMREGPLDMRMNTNDGLSASQWLMQAKEDDMVLIFKRYGEEKFAKRIAKAIIEERQTTVIDTTLKLVNIIDKAKPIKEKNKHPSTRIFQAIRIHINRELEDLETFLNKCLDVLAVNGRLVVISFHSLEDRIVKKFMQGMSRGKRFPAEVPIPSDELDKTKRLKCLSKGIKPSDDEIKNNVRARSAVLRIGEKIR